MRNELVDYFGAIEKWERSQELDEREARMTASGQHFGWPSPRKLMSSGEDSSEAFPPSNSNCTIRNLCARLQDRTRGKGLGVGRVYHP